MILIPIVLVGCRTQVIVYDWKVYDTVRILRRNFLMNAAHEFDSVRDKSGREVWIPGLAISPVV
jgi:hypothetical protein